MSSVVGHQIFGKATYPTVYYFTPYGSGIKRFRAHIWLFVRAGFRVVAFEYDKSVLAGGNPRVLPATIDEITEWVKKDAVKHRVAGVFGMSLGAYIGWNIMKRTDIQYGFYCTGGTKATNTIWNASFLEQEKLAFEEAGYSKHDLDLAWKDIDKVDKFKGKKIVVVYSVDDEVTTYQEASQNFIKWQEQGTVMQKIELKRSNHEQTVKRGLLKIQTLLSFFRKASAEQKPLNNQR